MIKSVKKELDSKDPRYQYTPRKQKRSTLEKLLRTAGYFVPGVGAPFAAYDAYNYAKDGDTLDAIGAAVAGLGGLALGANGYGGGFNVSNYIKNMIQQVSGGKGNWGYKVPITGGPYFPGRDQNDEPRILPYIPGQNDEIHLLPYGPIAPESIGSIPQSPYSPGINSINLGDTIPPFYGGVYKSKPQSPFIPWGFKIDPQDPNRFNRSGIWVNPEADLSRFFGPGAWTYFGPNPEAESGINLGATIPPFYGAVPKNSLDNNPITMDDVNQLLQAVNAGTMSGIDPSRIKPILSFIKNQHPEVVTPGILKKMQDMIEKAQAPKIIDLRQNKGKQFKGAEDAEDALWED